MPFDANLILKGLYSSALVDTDESDASPISLTANSDGNAVVEIKETGAKGLAAVIVMTEVADADAYSDETTVAIQESDELDRNWETIAQSKVLRSHLILLPACTATTALVAGDVGQVLTATTDGATGVIVAFDEALKTIGGIGDILVEMQDNADVYGTAADTLTSAVTGVATQGVAGVVAVPTVQDQPGVHVVRFTTTKRYVRAVVTAADNVGKCWILITPHAFRTL